MPNDELDDLRKRLEALEKRGSGRSRFFMQYLLAPVLVVAIGVLLNRDLEKQKTEVMQLQLAQQILPTLFSDDPHSAFAAQQLMRRALSDVNLQAEIQTLVTSYYLNRVQSLIDAGDIESANAIVQAAQSVGGDLGTQFVDVVKKDERRAAALTDYQTAVARERDGFQHLINSRYDDAIAAFDDAEAAYSQFHQVYEIGRLLRANRDELDTDGGRLAVLRRIVEDMSWKAPPDLLARLRAEIGAAEP